MPAQPCEAAQASQVRLIGPSPFSENRRILLDGSVSPSARLEIYDVGGRCIRRLAYGPTTDGPIEVRWDGRDDAGKKAAGGIYFLRLNAGDRSQSRRLVLVR